jgi:DNA-binding NarL/FixJ family response regulator
LAPSLWGTMPKRILIADDNPAMRRFIRSVLEGRENVEVCGEAVDGVDAIEKARELRPDLAILDFSMPRMHGLEAGCRLKELMPSVLLVLYTMHKDAVRKEDLVRSGFAAVISKMDGMDALIGGVESVFAARLGKN